MQMNCPGCGAGFSVNALAAMWKCAHCGRSNPNEGFIRQQIDKIDFNKSKTSTELGKVDYGSGRYAQAITHFEFAIREHGENAEAWAYYALAAAKVATLADINDRCALIATCLQRAKNLDAAAEIVSLSDALCRNSIGTLAWRGVVKFHEEARRAWAAFESVDRRRAAQAAHADVRHGLEIAAQGFGLEAEDPKIACGLASATLSLLNEFERITGVAHEMRQRAEQTIRKHQRSTAAAAVRPPVVGRKPASAVLIVLLVISGCVFTLFLFSLIAGVWH